MSSSSAVVDVEILFELLYHALERTRDHLKRRKRREAESPSLLEEEDLAFFKDDETEQPGLLEEMGSPFNDEKQTRDFQMKRNDGLHLNSKDFVKQMLLLARKRRDSKN